MATKVIIALLQQKHRYIKNGLLSDMIAHYPDIDVELILRSVRQWPGPSLQHVAEYIRLPKTPEWLYRGLLGLPTVEGTAIMIKSL